MPPKRSSALSRTRSSRLSSRSAVKSRHGENRDEISQFGPDSPIVGLLETNGYEIADSDGDGNCLFRSFSTCLTGSERSHLEIRRLIVAELARAMPKAIAMGKGGDGGVEDGKKGVVGKRIKVGRMTRKKITAETDDEKSDVNISDDESMMDTKPSNGNKAPNGFLPQHHTNNNNNNNNNNTPKLNFHIPDYHFFVLTQFSDYLKNMSKPTIWGGHLEIQALANIFGIKIVILQDCFPPFFVNPDRSLWPLDPDIVLHLLFRGQSHYDAVIPQSTRKHNWEKILDKYQFGEKSDKKHPKNIDRFGYDKIVKKMSESQQRLLPEEYKEVLHMRYPCLIKFPYNLELCESVFDSWWLTEEGKEASKMIQNNQNENKKSNKIWKNNIDYGNFDDNDDDDDNDEICAEENGQNDNNSLNTSARLDNSNCDDNSNNADIGRASEMISPVIKWVFFGQNESGNKNDEKSKQSKKRNKKDDQSDEEIIIDQDGTFDNFLNDILSNGDDEKDENNGENNENNFEKKGGGQRSPNFDSQVLVTDDINRLIGQIRKLNLSAGNGIEEIKSEPSNPPNGTKIENNGEDIDFALIIPKLYFVFESDPIKSIKVKKKTQKKDGKVAKKSSKKSKK
jgi:hypothetical protein